MPLLLIVSSALFAGCSSLPHHSVNRIRASEIASAEIPASLDGYRIAFVSDIHFGNNFSRKHLARLIADINETDPDCIIIGGDDTLGPAQIAPFANAASALHAPEGVYAVIGNHDFFNGWQESIRTLRDAGIVVLDETLIRTPRGLTIAGINDFRDTFPVMNKMNDILLQKDFTVLACHDPDFVEKISPEELSLFDLVLCGHLHGGQITFFGYAPVLPSEYGQKYKTGTVYKNGVPVIISNGAGYGGMVMKFRFGAPSDFLLITLRSTSPKSDR